MSAPWENDPAFKDADRRYNYRDYNDPHEAYFARVQALREMRNIIEGYDERDEFPDELT